MVVGIKPDKSQGTVPLDTVLRMMHQNNKNDGKFLKFINKTKQGQKKNVPPTLHPAGVVAIATRADPSTPGGDKNEAIIRP